MGKKIKYTSFEDDPGINVTNEDGTSIFGAPPSTPLICGTCIYRKRDLSCGIMPPEYHSAVLQTNECSKYKKKDAI